MRANQLLAERFEANRGHLRAVAYRMLGSLTEVDDAVQESWFRLSRTDTSEVQNLEGWLTTVVSRVCLDMLRSRKSRREESLDARPPDLAPANERSIDPEEEMLMAESVGVALLVVLDRLAPAERVAFILHDVFNLSFEEIAGIIDRSPAAARQLASRARRRIQGTPSVPAAELRQQRDVIDSFLSALRAGDFDALIAALDPDIVRRADKAALAPGAPTEIRGAIEVVKETLTNRERARFAQAALVDGSVGILVAPKGRLFVALRCDVRNRKIYRMEVIGDPATLERLEIAVLPRADLPPSLESTWESKEKMNLYKNPERTRQPRRNCGRQNQTPDVRPMLRRLSSIVIATLLFGVFPIAGFAQGQTYYGRMKGNEIDKNYDGEIIVLHDHSVWSVSERDRGDAQGWSAMDDITIRRGTDSRYPYKLLDTDRRNESVNARFIGYDR